LSPRVRPGLPPEGPAKKTFKNKGIFDGFPRACFGFSFVFRTLHHWFRGVLRRFAFVFACDASTVSAVSPLFS
jgi:hypothetical protein